MYIVCKQWNKENIVDIHIWFIDSEVTEIYVSVLLWKENDKVSTFIIVSFPNFEISVCLELAPHLTFKKFNKRRERLLEEI